MRNPSGTGEELTFLQRRLWSDLFAAVAVTLLAVAVIVWGGLGRSEAGGVSVGPLLGLFLLMVLGVPSWVKWFRTRARLRDVTASGNTQAVT